MSVSLTSQQETVECMHCKQNYCRCCFGDLIARVGTRVAYVAVRTTDEDQVLPEIIQTATGTLQIMQQVYSDYALSCSVVFRWNRHFSQGRDSYENDVRIGRPQTIRT